MKKIMEKKNEIPMVRLIKIFSWLITLGGIVGGIGFVVLRIAQHGMVIGAGIIVMGLIAALGLRMLGVIGQILFNTQALLWETQTLLGKTQTFLFNRLNEIQTQTDNVASAVSEINLDTRKQLEVLNTSLRFGHDTITEKIVQATQRLSKNTDSIQQQCVQISCDSKDINNNINQIKECFNQIAKRLDINE